MASVLDEPFFENQFLPFTKDEIPDTHLDSLIGGFNLYCLA